MTININGRLIAVIAATIGVGAASFFGGQATRLSDDAIASHKTAAVTKAVNKSDTEHAVEMAELKRQAAEHEKRAVRKAARKAKRTTRSSSANAPTG